MNTQVTEVCSLSSELPTDPQQAPAWLVSVLQVPREEGWIDSGGCKVHYFRWGNPENPPLLLMHGFLAHARCFAFIAPFLAEHYHVVAYDLSGMGDSEARASLTPIRSGLKKWWMLLVGQVFLNTTQSPSSLRTPMVDTWA